MYKKIIFIPLFLLIIGGFGYSWYEDNQPPKLRYPSSAKASNYFLHTNQVFDIAPPFLELTGNMLLRKTEKGHTATPVNMLEHRGKWVFIAYGLVGDGWTWSPNHSSRPMGNFLGELKKHLSGNIETWFVRVNYFRNAYLPYKEDLCTLLFETSSGKYVDLGDKHPESIIYRTGGNGIPGLGESAQGLPNSKPKCVDRYMYALPHRSEINTYFTKWYESQIYTGMHNQEIRFSYTVWPAFMLINPKGVVVATWGRDQSGGPVTRLSGGTIINSMKYIIDKSPLKGDVIVKEADDPYNKVLFTAFEQFNHDGCKGCGKIMAAMNAVSDSLKIFGRETMKNFEIDKNSELYKKMKKRSLTQSVFKEPAQ